MGRSRLLVKGFGFIVMAGSELAMMVKLALKATPNVLEWAKGSGPGTIKENLGDDWDGSVEYGAFDLDNFATMIGGTVVTGCYKRVKQGVETQTISSSEITLDNAPCTGTEFLYGAAGTKFKRVTTSPEIGEYTIDGDTCTFNASETETTIYPEYIYADAASGEKIVVPVSAAPADFELYGCLDMTDKFAASGSQAKILAIYARSCTRTGELELGGGNGEAVTQGFDFHVNNDSVGDLVISRD